MRLIHTADIHLDASFAASGMPPTFGNRRRQSLRDVFSRILRRAAEWPADAVLIAGDLFELERVSRDTLVFLRESMRKLSPIPIFIAPGNHDPFTRTSAYALETWPSNVLIFSQPRWQAHALKHLPLTVHGFAFDGVDISENPFGKLQVPRDGRIHVAVAHGSEKGHQPPDKASYAPFDAGTAVPSGLHYLALGHFHAYTPIDGAFHAVACYSGAPEGHGFNEAGARHYIEVEIATGENEVHVDVRPVPSSQVIYASYTLDISDLRHSHEVVEAIRALAREDEFRQIARVRLKGSCAHALAQQIAAIHDAVADAFEFLQITTDLQPLEDYEELARQRTSLGAFIQRMNGDVAAAPDPERLAVLTRAREIGLAAYRNQTIPPRGLNGSAR